VRQKRAQVLAGLPALETAQGVCIIMALTQCLECKNIKTVKDVSGKFLYSCKIRKIINKPESCPYFK
jgi:uncharacterized protein (UPF0179 family)